MINKFPLAAEVLRTCAPTRAEPLTSSDNERHTHRDVLQELSAGLRGNDMRQAEEAWRTRNSTGNHADGSGDAWQQCSPGGGSAR